MKGFIQNLQIAVVIISLLMTPCFSFAQAKDFYGFSKILKGEQSANKNTSIIPTVFEADLKGGTIQLRMPNTSGTCNGDYEFTWQFSEDILLLEMGKEYPVEIKGRRLGGACDQNTAKAFLRSGDAGSSLLSNAGLKSDRAKSIQFIWKNSYIVDANETNSGNALQVKVVVNGKPNAEYSSFGLHFYFSSFPYSSTSKLCTFDVLYVYQKNKALTGSITGPVNCPTLYGLGVNIGILEYGALENAKNSFLVGFLDHAISHVKASGCIPGSELLYLVDLKDRMIKKETGNEFASEISAFRQKLAILVNDVCDCNSK